jgi:hypothetical protein
MFVQFLCTCLLIRGKVTSLYFVKTQIKMNTSRSLEESKIALKKNFVVYRTKIHPKHNMNET